MSAHPFDIARDIAHEIVASDRDVPVREQLPPEAVSDMLGLPIPKEGLGLEDTVAKLRGLVKATPSTASESFFNQLFGGRDEVAVMADMVASVLNNSMYTYKVAGPHVLVEEALIRHMGAKMGFADPGGIFSPGGSLSNLVALLLARHRVMPDSRAHGVSGRLRVYTSASSHYSIRKGASVVGVGRENVIKIPTDREGRMLPDALDAAIRSDLAEGHLPMMVNATCGTTTEGSFDPINAIADITEQHGVWLHLDGAYGATMVLSARYSSYFEGSHRADSVTWDAHKMMGVPLTSSVLLTRERGSLYVRLSGDAWYLFQAAPDVLNPGVRSLQCGRRNDFLKVWVAWQYHGDDGYEARVNRCMALVAHALNRIESHPQLTLTIQAESMNVCFTVEGLASEWVCEKLHRDGHSMVGFATVAGEQVVRLVLVNPDHTEADVDRFFDGVEALLP